MEIAPAVRFNPSQFQRTSWIEYCSSLLGWADHWTVGGMKGITIKLPEGQLRLLKEMARRSNRSVAALVRDMIEGGTATGDSVYALSSDLAGSLSGGTASATNSRRKIGRK